MGKRVLVSLVAFMSLGAIWWTYAWAGCLQYRTIGGSSVCTAYETKGVLFKVKFKEACTFDDESAGCTASVRTDSTDNVAFCASTDPLNPIRVTNCTAHVQFTGSTNSVNCVAKHDDRDPFGPGVGHEHHGCTATVNLVKVGSCDSCCVKANGDIIGTGVCVDVTPVEMDTAVLVTAADTGGGGDFTTYENGGSGTCAPGDSSCFFRETCSINPKKIQFIDPATDPDFSQSRPYQCNIACVGLSETCTPIPSLD